MKWFRCLFSHDWRCIDQHPVMLWEEGRSRPWGCETRFLFKCSKCKKLKSKCVKGYWDKKIEDTETQDEFYANL